MSQHDFEDAPRRVPFLTSGSTPRGPWSRLPGSKSLTQRYFNLALLGGNRLIVRHPLISEDTLHYLQALEICGCRVERRGAAGDPAGDAHTVDHVIIDATRRSDGGDIFCGAGGTMMRFLSAALTAIPGRWRLDGIERLRERPLGPLLAATRQLGGDARCLLNEGFPPLEIHGSTLQGGSTTLDAGASSQFLSALLMAGLAAPRPSTLRLQALTSQPYVDLTLDAIGQLGGSVERVDDATYRVLPGGLTDGDITVDVDDSAVAYPAAAAALTGGEVLLSGLRRDSRQGDRRFLDLLDQMGATVTWAEDGVRIVGGPLEAIDVDMSDIPDQVPTVAALAPFAEGTTVIRNVPHLRLKESDRLSAMAGELQRLGATVKELPDGLEIDGTWQRRPAPETPVTVASHGDHRIAMSMALVGLRRPGVSIANPQVVAKSYPEFWRHLEAWLEGGPHHP